MKTDLILSISVAAVSHAVALFAFNESSVPAPEAVEEIPMITYVLPPIPQVESLEPEIDENEIVDFTESANETGPSESFEPAVSSAAEGPRNLAPISHSTIQVPVGQTNIGLPPGTGAGSWGKMVIPGIESLDETPRALAQIAPRYPHEMRRSGVDGSVDVRFVVGPDGKVQTAEVVRFSHREFAEAAMIAVKKWRFEPGRRNGSRVSFRMTVPVVFSVSD